MSGTWHPDGCRCSGCRQPALRTPARYQRPAASRPVYRYPPRSHTSTCPCARCVQARSRPGDWGIIGPLVLVIGIIAVVGFWPAMVWHGYGGPEGTSWRWDIHSTIGCCVWWGLTVVPILIAAIVNGHKKRALRPVQVPASVPEALKIAAKVRPAAQPPLCAHRGAVPVDLVTGERVAWWCPDCQTRLDPAFRGAQ